MKPTLIIMAAGMGNRYGGLKQLDALGPSGETIMDYSVFNAIATGFQKIVFVIRKSFEQDFREKVLSKYRNKIDCDVVFQEIDKLPIPFKPPLNREKPWGTNHALMMASSIVEDTFCVINADDYYGKEAFSLMIDAFFKLPKDSKRHYFIVAYKLGNTLSESGSVSRGICNLSPQNKLESIKEYRQLILKGDTIYDEETKKSFSPDTLVSMNFWGFTPDYFSYSDELFKEFLSLEGQKLNSEFYIPSVVARLIEENKAEFLVMQTKDSWFGVTYAEDRQKVVDLLQSLHDKGEYPTPLFI